ncbi:MAG: metallophosphoesterase [Terrimicrobiaceae bacterium]|nr:metallophosphoesterase [Terrimicrobiaceae bacterium]
METHPKTLRVAAVGDLHYTRHCRGRLESLFSAASAAADVLLLCGDLTDYGLVEEARLLADDLRAHLKIPAVSVLGNHDFEAGQSAEITRILDDVGVHVLDGETHEIDGVGFAGVPGFGGGFGTHMLSAWGEPIIKAFVQEAVDQALRLEKALSRLESPRRVAVLHYAPIVDTVAGEPPEIFPFLGSSRLEGALNRFSVACAVHGHAHRGKPFGRTGTGIPVHNVALPLLEKTSSKPFVVIEI